MRAVEPFPNDTPGPVAGGCARDGCGHARDDHYATRRTFAPFVGDPYSEGRYLEGRGPCNVRGEWTHCICYEWLPMIDR